MKSLISIYKNSLGRSQLKRRDRRGETKKKPVATSKVPRNSFFDWSRVVLSAVWAFDFAVLHSPDREYQRGDGSSTTKQINSVRPPHMQIWPKCERHTQQTQVKRRGDDDDDDDVEVEELLLTDGGGSHFNTKLLRETDGRAAKGRERNARKSKKALLVIVCCPPFLDTLIQLLTHIDSTLDSFVCVHIQQLAYTYTIYVYSPYRPLFSPRHSLAAAAAALKTFGLLFGRYATHKHVTRTHWRWQREPRSSVMAAWLNQLIANVTSRSKKPLLPPSAPFSLYILTRLYILYILLYTYI